jgi:hypothetical protein
MRHNTWFLTLPSFRGYWLPVRTVSSALPKASLAWSLGLLRGAAAVNQLCGMEGGGCQSGSESFHPETESLALVPFLHHAVFHIFP